MLVIALVWITMKVGILMAKIVVKKKAMIAPLAPEVRKPWIFVLIPAIAISLVKTLAIQPITRAVTEQMKPAKEILVTVYIKNVVTSAQTILILTATCQPAMSRVTVAIVVPAPNIKLVVIPPINTSVLMMVMTAMPTKTVAQEHPVTADIKLVIANPDIIGMPRPVLVI